MGCGFVCPKLMWYNIHMIEVVPTFQESDLRPFYPIDGPRTAWIFSVYDRPDILLRDLDLAYPRPLFTPDDLMEFETTEDAREFHAMKTEIGYLQDLGIPAPRFGLATTEKRLLLQVELVKGLDPCELIGTPEAHAVDGMIEALEPMYNGLISYLESKYVGGGPLLADIYGLNQYVFEPPQEDSPGQMKLVDLDFYLAGYRDGSEDIPAVIAHHLGGLTLDIIDVHRHLDRPYGDLWDRATTLGQVISTDTPVAEKFLDAAHQARYGDFDALYNFHIAEEDETFRSFYPHTVKKARPTEVVTA